VWLAYYYCAFADLLILLHFSGLLAVTFDNHFLTLNAMFHQSPYFVNEHFPIRDVQNIEIWWLTWFNVELRLCFMHDKQVPLVEIWAVIFFDLAIFWNLIYVKLACRFLVIICHTLQGRKRDYFMHLIL